VDVALEDDVVEESRISRLESDVSHMRGDIADLKTDGREMRKDVAALKADGAALRGEMITGFASLRDEMHKGDAALRDEMHIGFATLEKSVEKVSSDLKIWMYGFAGALLTIMAHSFKWI
jgi:hypothetical protein